MSPGKSTLPKSNERSAIGPKKMDNFSKISSGEFNVNFQKVTYLHLLQCVSRRLENQYNVKTRSVRLQRGTAHMQRSTLLGKCRLSWV